VRWRRSRRHRSCRLVGKKPGTWRTAVDLPLPVSPSTAPCETTVARAARACRPRNGRYRTRRSAFVAVVAVAAAVAVAVVAVAAAAGCGAVVARRRRRWPVVRRPWPSAARQSRFFRYLLGRHRHQRCRHLPRRIRVRTRRGCGHRDGGRNSGGGTVSPPRRICRKTAPRPRPQERPLGRRTWPASVCAVAGRCPRPSPVPGRRRTVVTPRKTRLPARR